MLQTFALRHCKVKQYACSRIRFYSRAKEIRSQEGKGM
jgi:hypothetical protein